MNEIKNKRITNKIIPICPSCYSFPLFESLVYTPNNEIFLTINANVNNSAQFYYCIIYNNYTFIRM